MRGVRPRVRRVAAVRRPDARLDLGRLSPRHRHTSRRWSRRAADVGARFGGAAMKPAVFLDRDGTVIEQVHYLADPAEVRLIPGAASAIRRLARRGIRLRRRHQPVGDRPGDARPERLERGPRRDVPASSRPSGCALDGIYFCPRGPGLGRRDRDRAPRPQAGARGCSSAPRASWAWTSRARGWSATWSATSSPGATPGAGAASWSARASAVASPTRRRPTTDSHGRRPDEAAADLRDWDGPTSRSPKR